MRRREAAGGAALWMAVALTGLGVAAVRAVGSAPAEPHQGPTPETTVLPTASVSATLETPATVAATETATATVAATETATATVAATEIATATPTVAPTTDTATATDRPPDADRLVHLPYLARTTDLAPAPPRTWGLQFALEDFPEELDKDVAVELPRGRSLGLRAIRTNIRWDWLEPVDTDPDRYDWSRYDARLATYADAGYDLMVTLVAYPAWATRYQCGYALLPGMEAEWREFVASVAARYGADRYRVVAWEIGNEVDGKTFVGEADYERSPDWGGGQPTTPYGGCWGDRAPEYEAFLRAAYEEIEAADPDSLVTLGGLANADIYDMFHMDFLERLLEAGGGASFDFLSYHWFPDVPGQASGPEKLDRLTDTLRRHGTPKRVWLTETYRLTYPADPAGEASQIRFLTQEIVEVLASPDLDRVYWYGWSDFPPELKADPSAADRGIVGHDRSPKAALPILRWLIEYSNGVADDRSASGLREVVFSWPRAVDRRIVWSEGGLARPLVLAARRGSRAEATYFPADMLLAGDCCAHAEVPESGGSIVLDVGSDSLFVVLTRP